MAASILNMNALLLKLRDLLEKLKALLLKQKAEQAVVSPINVEPPPPAPIPTQYLWDTFDDALHSTRVICDEEGLTYDMQYGVDSSKNILCACVRVESDFNLRAVHHNRTKDGTITSTDYGIVQVNDYFHIGAGKDFPTVDYVLQNPAICIRWMAKLFKAGKANLWSSYNNNAYKAYL